jgi:hypothetical protein
MDYVALLKDKVEEGNSTIPGKDLTDPRVCKDILVAMKMFEEGKVLENTMYCWDCSPSK